MLKFMYKFFRTWRRPWGQYEVLHDEGDFKTKFITVDPHQRISYQYHHKREEHWLVLSGQGTVTLDEHPISVFPGSHVHIPIGAQHRIENTTAEPLIFFELQLGSYFGEDDIVRLQDDYQRVEG